MGEPLNLKSNTAFNRFQNKSFMTGTYRGLIHLKTGPIPLKKLSKHEKKNEQRFPRGTGQR